VRFNNLLPLLLLLACFSGGHEALVKEVARQEANLVSEVPEILINASRLKLRRNEGLVYHGNVPFSGYKVKRYSNGKPAEKAGYLHGKKHGSFERWRQDGIPAYRAIYLQGKRHGKALSWWKNGQLRSQTQFVQEKPHGELLQWYEDGQLFKKLTYNMGREEGMQQAWRKNGTLYVNYEARNGRVFGMKRANLCYSLKEETIELSK